MEIITQYEPSVAEIRDTVARNSAKARRTWWLNTLIGIVGGTALLIPGVAISPDSSYATLEDVLGVVLLVFGAFHILMLRMGTKPAADRLAARLCGPTSLRMSDDRYRFELPAEKGEVLWELTRIVVSPEAWTFAVSARVNLIVPKRALSTQDQATFADFIAHRDRKLVKTV